MKVKLSTLSMTRMRGPVIGHAPLLIGAGVALPGRRDRILVALGALVGLHRRKQLLAKFVGHRVLEFALGLDDQAWRGQRIAGHNLVGLDDEVTAILGIRDQTALAL